MITSDKATPLLHTIIKALQVPRDRMGRLVRGQETFALSDALRQLKEEGHEVPHGGLDTIDQVAMILQCIVGDKPTSAVDR